MRLKRLVFRLCYYPAMWIAKPLILINQKLYNKLVYNVLKWGGVNFVGQPRFISRDVYLDDFKLITLGKEIVISKDVTFLTHDYSITTALVACHRRPKQERKIDGKITVGDNVFIGLGTTLLPGTTIGENTIIGARSVVKGNIPAGSVVCGNPAKVIMTITEYMERKDRQGFAVPK